ncbi:accessory Sec system protein Asp2 [Leuconostoc gasicomitatum]|uniref:accessory Sec system protein Asp2 n=1 Tax=Leuconostoc gasicomitatum TaxID=115778 RepID=UPI001CC4332E|nr:accessory Sec system protein Asp2 [Leuconostoc gasicomitatum]MBZ5970658.1 accessory Sec system protein Asp2 [Leuconostoc gasicomitatum]MBZ5997677.1 accessory Sec system protein Asp2 [Leuconostoc gasicomitatum]
MADISVLQIGADDWTADIDTTGIDWQYTTILDLPTRLALQKDPYVLEQTYVVLTDATLSSTLLSGQISAWPALRTIYFAKKMTPEFQEVLDERRAFCIPNRTPEAVQKRIQEDFNFDQIGFSTRFSEQQFIPMPPTGIHFKREGRFSAQFSGDFGTTWQQIGTLNTFVGDLMPRVENMIWLDYEQTDTVSVQLQFVFYKDNHMQTVQTITGDELRQQHPIGGIDDYQDYQILIFAKGTGQLDLHVLHQRRSRHLLGTLLPGDEWQMTDEHEEVLSYFNPGDRQAPLIVNFSGIRLHVDGFEMRGPFNELGTPYLLFSDVRMQGGAFHIGSEMYEQKVVEIIKKAMKTLHLEPKDVILTGYSMGSFPAMYYAADIKPHAIVVAKPLISLGTLTGKSEFPREVNQDWTLDVRRFLAGRMDPDDTDMLDNILWQHIENVDWSKIAVALFTLKQDEYDGQSLPRLLAFFEENKTHLIHIQEEGTHTAKIPEMITFMKTHLAKLKDSMRREDR